VRWATEPGESPLFGPERGCNEFEQRVLRFDSATEDRSNDADDEVLYVLSGSARATVGGEPADLSPGTAAFVACGSSWRIEEADGLEVLSVLVRDPLPADGSTHAVVAADAVESSQATAGRSFRLLATPELGCTSVTQFVGYDGETAHLRAGSCIHLPARLVHCIENTGPGELRVLGVFRPAGSPAEAYYPDGTLARY